VLYFVLPTEAIMSAEPTEDWLASLPAEKIYTEICTGISETDNASFRLLSLVPLVSGTALIGLVLQKQSLPPEVVLLLSMFAAGITFGLFRWETAEYTDPLLVNKVRLRY
jgi:hypothetical protein